MYSFFFIFSYFIVILVIGIITINSYRRFIIKYRIYGKAKKRDFHKQPIPNSCGVVFFFVFTLGLIILEPFLSGSDILGLIVSCFVICVTGFWDDLKIMSPYKKLFYQVIAVGFIVIHNDLVIENLNGFIGIRELSPLPGTIFTTFIGVFMINSFNLIDGIDGLSGITSIISFFAFSIIFWVLDFKGYFGVCFLLIAIIAAYLPFNFSTKRKTFMGDSGSMFIGFILFVMSMLVVNSSAPILNHLFNPAIIPVAPLCIFILPIIDSASIYLYRLSIGRSPFSPDKFHLHHIFLLLTKSHLVSSLAISAFLGSCIIVFSLLAFRISTIQLISSYFILIFTLVILINIARVILKKRLSKL